PVAADVGQRRETLRVAGRRVLGVAAGIAVEVEEETELDGLAVNGAVAVPRAVARAAALLVDVDGVVGVGDRARDHLRDLGLDRRDRGGSARRRARIDRVAVGRHAGPDDLAVRSG